MSRLQKSFEPYPNLKNSLIRPQKTKSQNLKSEMKVTHKTKGVQLYE